MLTDFTRNRDEVIRSLDALRNASTFGDSNLFDGLRFVLVGGGDTDDVHYQGLKRRPWTQGGGRDRNRLNGFSKASLDDVPDSIAYTGIPVYTVGIGAILFLRAEPFLNDEAHLGILQAQNNLRIFAEESSGRYYNVRFQGEIAADMEAIGALLQHQYVLRYSPSQTRAGKRQKIEVLVDLDNDGKPDNKNLDLQYRHYRLQRIT